MKIQFTRWPYGARCAFTSSWDDGHTTDLELLKILEKYGVKGTFFISSELVDEPKYLNSKQIRDIIQKGHEIGSHGQIHQKLCSMDETQVKIGLVNSKAEIEKLSGDKIFGFSYPFGSFDKKIKKLTKLAGYKYARTTKFGTIHFPPNDWFEWNPSVMAQGRGGYRNRYIPRYFRYVGLQTFFKSGFPRDWGDLAQNMFKGAYERGGLFHLWGHSTRLFEKNEIKKFDMFLSSISNLSDIWFARNIDVYRYEITRKSVSIQINRVSSKKKEIKVNIDPKIKPSSITLEIEKPDSSLIFKSDCLSIEKCYQNKRLLVTFSPKRLK